MKPPLLTACEASVSGQTTPKLANSAGGQGNNCSEKSLLPSATPFTQVRSGWQTPPTLSKHALRPHPAEFLRFPAPLRPIALARACTGPSSEVSTWSSDAPEDNSPAVLGVTPGVDPSLTLTEHGPCLVGGIITLDDVSCTVNKAAYSGANALTSFGCSPQTFIRRDVLNSMLSVGEESVVCGRQCAPRSWGVFGEFAPLQTLTSVRLSIQLF